MWDKLKEKPEPWTSNIRRALFCWGGQDSNVIKRHNEGANFWKNGAAPVSPVL